MIGQDKQPNVDRQSQFIELHLNSSDQIMGKRQTYAIKNQVAQRATQKQILNVVSEKYEINVQIRKLILAYSKKGVDTHLTKDQFIDLANDIMSTIDYPKLNKSQIKSVFNAIDSNSDDTISAAELEQIIKNNKIK